MEEIGGGGASPSHLIEPQVELNEEYEHAAMEPHIQYDEGAALQYTGYGSALEYYAATEDGLDSSTSYAEDASEITMDESNSEAYDSTNVDETNYNEMQRAYLSDFYSSSGAVEDHVDENAESTTDPTIERIQLNRINSIVKVVERAEYETLQILYQLLYQRSAWDTQEILCQRILEFSGFRFRKNSEEWRNREMMLQTLPNSTLVKIGAILCLDHVKSVLSNAGLGRHDLINAIMEFLALPKKKTRGPRSNVHRAVSSDSNVKPCGCRLNCLARFTEKQREHILNFYNSFKRKKAQDAYLFNVIKMNKSPKSPVKKANAEEYNDAQELKKDPEFGSKKNRDYKYTYRVKVGIKEVDVCKGGFMLIHDIRMSRLNQFQARLKKGCYMSRADVLASACPAVEGEEELLPKEEPQPQPAVVEPSLTTAEVPSEKEPLKTEPEPVREEPVNSKVDEPVAVSAENSVSNNSVDNSSSSISSKTEDNEDVNKSSKEEVKLKNGENEVDGKSEKHKLKDFPLVVKGMDEAAEELLIDLHFLLFLSGAESNKLKDNILEFNGFTFNQDSEEYDERNDFLQRMSGKLLTEVARAFSLGVKSKREETIENILGFLMEPKESYLRTAPSVPIILSDVEIDDIEGMSDSDESITCEVVEKKVECIDILSEGELSSGDESTDPEGKKKKKKDAVKSSVTMPVASSTILPSTTVAKVESNTNGGIRALRDFETIRKIVNTHPPEYLVDIYELLFLKKHEPATLRDEILSFTGFTFEKGSQDYIKRKQVLDRMLYNNVRRVYNTLIHNSTEVKVFSKPTMINEIFQFLFKLPDHDTSVRPLPPGAKTLMPKASPTVVSKSPVSSTTASPAPTAVSILPSPSGKLSDLKRVFQRVACFPCEYLVDVHKLLFMTDCDPKVIRQNIFGFKGFSFGKESQDFQQRKMYLEYLTFHSLRKISSVLTTRSVDLRNSTKHELASHLTDVLAEYCNTHVETASIVPNLSTNVTISTPAPAPSVTSTTVESIVVTPSIETIRSVAKSVSSSSSSKPPSPSPISSSSSSSPPMASSASTSSTNIAITEAHSVNSTTDPKSRKRRQTIRTMLPPQKKIAPSPNATKSAAQTPNVQPAEFADIHLPEVEQYRQIYGTNLNVYPSVPTITGITSFSTGIAQPFQQIVPQTMAYPFVSPYPQTLQVQNIQQAPQVLGLQSTAITMTTPIITQVNATAQPETIVPAEIEKPPEDPKAADSKTDAVKSVDMDEEDGDKPLASLVGHPMDSVLEKNIDEIVKKTNLQDITMNGVIQRVYDIYPKFDLSYRKDFIKSTLRTILYKLGNENQKGGIKSEGERDSNSPDCSVSTTDRDNSLPASPEAVN